MKALDTLLDFIFPPRCAGCGEIIASASAPLCPYCRTKWESEKRAACNRCRLPHTRCRCALKADSGGVIESSVHLAGYDARKPSVAKSIILAAKSSRDSRLFDFLARELAPLVSDVISYPDDTIVTYVPRSPENYRKYGIDQAEKLAKATAQIMELPFERTLIHNKSSHIQKELGAKDRLENSLKAYSATSDTLLKGKDIILIDDVITTGSSLYACACLLIGCGAKRIYAVSVGRTL